jgi:2'-5' RNA ligase
MEKRITLISYIDDNEKKKIEYLLDNIDIKICKVPFGIDDKYRYKIDNLPFHFTIFATNKENQNVMLELFNKIDIDKIKVDINDVKIMNGNDNSYVLYFSIENNEKLKQIQKIFYNAFNEEKYNPDNFLFHMTIHIDKDYINILHLMNIIKERFEPFSVEFSEIALYDYPGDLIQKLNCHSN